MMPDAKSRPLVIYRDAAIVAGVLVLYGALSWYVCSTAGPFRGDPDYQYLLSGMDILVGRMPNYYDHPGTPVESLIALGVLATWLLSLPWHGFSNVIDVVFADSQFYLSCICGFFSAAIAAAIAYFIWSFRTAIGSMGSAIVGVFSIFTSAAIYASFDQVSAEPMLLAGTFLLVALTVRAAHARDGSGEMRRLAIWVGIAAAFCVTVKVTSAPVLLTLLFLRTSRAKRRAFLACAAAGVFFLLPILGRARGMLRNYWHLFTHQGDYGTGGAGAPSLHTIWQNIVLLEQQVTGMFLCLALFVLIPVGARLLGKQIPKSLEHLLFLSASVILFSILLVSKQPRAYYLIPALAFMALGNAVIAHLLLKRIPLASMFAAAGVVIFGTVAFAAMLPGINVEAADWQADKALISRAQQSGCLVVSYYIVELPEWELYFGNLYTNGREFTPRLEKLYPDFVTYNGGPKRFETFSGILSPAQATQRFAREKCVYMIGLPWQTQFGISPKALDLVAQSRGGIALYSLRPGWETLR
jgi:hypothetical protein